MSQSPPVVKRPQSLGEEIANSISHGIGFLVAVAFSPLLVLSAIRRESVAGIVGVSVFAFTLALLYLISTLYHSLARNRARRCSASWIIAPFSY